MSDTPSVFVDRHEHVVVITLDRPEARNAIDTDVAVRLGAALADADADPATFGLPEVKRGIIAGAGGVLRLPEQLPRKVAMRAILTGEPLTAVDAERWGLVNEVVPAADLLDRALALAARVAANAPLAVQASKRIALGITGDEVPGETEGWARNQDEIERVVASADALEGITAFAQKRTPVWQGR